MVRGTVRGFVVRKEVRWSELIGDMHACTGCSMSKAIRKGTAHETKRRSDKKLGQSFC